MAVAKAQSAIKYQRPTKAMEDALKGGRQAILRLPGAMRIEGGLSIQAEGCVIAAIGVSGMQALEDAQVATAGLKALGQ